MVMKGKSLTHYQKLALSSPLRVLKNQKLGVKSRCAVAASKLVGVMSPLGCSCAEKNGRLSFPLHFSLHKNGARL